jgi:predicted 2-oxoglutarate/Fe(II)-dependent dioxygenase YbiX
VLPGLEVEGLGMIGLPLTAAQAEALKGKCEQAGYGKGEETLVDTNVRRVWKLPASKLSLTNPAWNKALEEIISSVQVELGLEGQALTAHLYDLLLYEKGGFFLPHRDGERLDRMVATLVVSLPSSYTGGELVVRNEGQEQVIDFSGASGRFQTHYAAFYADCEHEVRPVRSGFRLCLVYNLTLAKSGSAIGAPRPGERVLKLAKILREWAAQPADIEKLVVTLTHQYSHSGLKWDALKGLDRSRAVALAEAARASGCRAYLALLTLWESGSIAYDGEDEYGYGRHRRSRQRDPDDYVIEEMLDTSLTAEHWQDPDGKSMPLRQNHQVFREAQEGI